MFTACAGHDHLAPEKSLGHLSAHTLKMRPYDSAQRAGSRRHLTRVLQEGPESPRQFWTRLGSMGSNIQYDKLSYVLIIIWRH